MLEFKHTVLQYEASTGILMTYARELEKLKLAIFHFFMPR